MAWLMYWLCVKVNSIICMESLGVGISGHVCSRTTTLTHRMSSLSLTRQDHFVLWQVQLRIHGMMVLF